MNTLGDWTGIHTADQLVALTAVLALVLGIVNLGIYLWDRIPWSLGWRRRRAHRRMDAVCELQWSGHAIEQAQGTNERLVANMTVDQIVEYSVRQQMKAGQWYTLQTVACRIRPDGHIRVDPRQEATRVATIAQSWFTRLNWTIELPTGTRVSQSNRIVSRGRVYNITAVFDEYSDAEVVQVAAWSNQA